MRISPDGMVSETGEPVAVPVPLPLHACVPSTMAEQPSRHSPDDPALPLDSARHMLVQIIEGEIIPRLFLAHHTHQPNYTEACGELADCTFLAGLFLRNDRAGIVARLHGLLDRGIPYEHVCLELLAPVPRTLSLLWTEGRCSFDDMAQGLSCVDHVLQEMHSREHSDLR